MTTHSMVRGLIMAIALLYSSAAFAEDGPDWSSIAAAADSFSDETEERAKRADALVDPARVAKRIPGRKSPSKIFAWQRANIRFEPYGGRLRGARGALIARAANSVDQAELLSELMKANGFETRFVRGRMFPNEAAALLKDFAGSASLVDPSAATTGEGNIYDVSSMPRYQAMVTEHVWIEVKLPNGKWVPADPVLSDTLGIAKVEAQSTQTSPFDDLAGEFRIEVEATLKDGQTRSLLTREGKLAELIYGHLTLTFEENTGRKGRFHAILSVKDDARKATESLKPEDMEALRMRFTLRRGRVETRFDEIFFERGESEKVFGFSQQAFSVSVFPGWTPPAAAWFFGDKAVSEAAGNVRDLARAAKKGQKTDVVTASTRAHRDLGFVLASAFTARVDRIARDLAYTMGVNVIFAEPRVVVTGLLRRGTGYDYRISLRSAGLQVMPKAGVPPIAGTGYLTLMGRIAHGLQGEVLAELAGQKVLTVDGFFDAAAKTGGAPVTTIDLEGIATVGKLKFSAGERASVEDSVRRKGAIVLTTRRDVVINDESFRGWWVLDPTTGDLLGSLGDAMITTNTRPEANESPQAVSIATLALTKRLRDAIDRSVRPSEPTEISVCDARTDIERLATAMCATKKALTLPSLRACSNLTDSGDGLLSRRTCQERTEGFRCGVVASSALLQGELTTLYKTKGPLLDSSAGLQKPIGLTCPR